MSGGLGRLGIHLGQGFAARQEVVVHQLLCRAGIAGGQRRHDQPVLVQRLLQAAFEGQRMQSGELEYLAQVLNDGKQPAVAGKLLDFLVEFLVGFKKGIDATIAGSCFEPGVNVLQKGNIRSLGIPHCFGSTAPLEHGHQGKDIVQILAGYFGDVATTARPQLDQSLGGEHLESLPQRGARDSVIGGQGLFIHPGAGGEFVGKNALPQAFRDFLVQGEGGYPTSVHGLA